MRRGIGVGIVAVLLIFGIIAGLYFLQMGKIKLPGVSVTQTERSTLSEELLNQYAQLIDMSIHDQYNLPVDYAIPFVYYVSEQPITLDYSGTWYTPYYDLNEFLGNPNLLFQLNKNIERRSSKRFYIAINFNRLPLGFSVECSLKSKLVSGNDIAEISITPSRKAEFWNDPVKGKLVKRLFVASVNIKPNKEGSAHFLVYLECNFTNVTFYRYMILVKQTEGFEPLSSEKRLFAVKSVLASLERGWLNPIGFGPILFTIKPQTFMFEGDKADIVYIYSDSGYEIYGYTLAIGLPYRNWEDPDLYPVLRSFELTIKQSQKGIFQGISSLSTIEATSSLFSGGTFTSIKEDNKTVGISTTNEITINVDKIKEFAAGTGVTPIDFLNFDINVSVTDIQKGYPAWIILEGKYSYTARFPLFLVTVTA